MYERAGYATIEGIALYPEHNREFVVRDHARSLPVDQDAINRPVLQFATGPSRRLERLASAIQPF